MKQKDRLNPSEREFFTLVKEATLANPFSADRMTVDLQISGLFNDSPKEVILDETIREVRQRFRRLEQDGRADLRRYGEPDKTTLKAALMFDFFHTWCNDFDRMIEEQVSAAPGPPTAPPNVAFAPQALSDLEKKGFERDEAVHLFGLCFQLRRAYFFIDKHLVGHSRCMTRFREALWNNVFTSDLEFYTRDLWDRMEDFSTLIIGETGSGKGTAANAVGRSGFIPFDPVARCFTENFTTSFVSLNLSQFPENLIESELFGHKKGSFTGAVEDHEGVFARCSAYGAIFLDEIGEVSPPIQIKLLKVLEEREFSPVGSREVRRFKGRIITATNRSFAQLRNPDIFRQDFYYRLCSDIIMVPSLSRRIKENPRELDNLIENRVSRIIGYATRSIVTMLRQKLHKNLGRHYEWPGNVRELEQYIRRILLNRNGDILHGTELPGDTGNTGDAGTRLAGPVSRGEIKAQDLIKAYCWELYRKSGVIGEVARRTGLDRRTVKKYCDDWAGQMPE